jgi:hypothetical protein
MGDVPHLRMVSTDKGAERGEFERLRIRAALERLRLACELVDMAGRGLAPFVPQACGEALLDLSVELSRIESMMARRALGGGTGCGLPFDKVSDLA